MKAHILSLLLGALPVATLAQDTIGTAQGAIDDTAYNWFFTQQDGRSQSGFDLIGPFVMVTLFGHAVDDNIMATKDGMVLTWTIYDQNNPVGAETELRFMPEQNYLTAYVSPEDEPLALDITTFDLTEAGLHVAGTASATLAWTEQPGYPGDPNNTKDMTISFDVILPPKS